MDRTVSLDTMPGGMSMDGRKWFPRICLGGITVLILFAAASCADPPKQGQNQEQYKNRVIRARESLSEGRLTYSVLEDAAPGESQKFRVEITGLAFESPPPADPGAEHREESVLIGATLGARLHCSGAQVKCILNSSERQSVLASGDSAEWQWTVETPQAGTVRATLTITAYYRNEDLVLTEPEPINQSIKVEEENFLLALLGDFWKWLVGAISAMGGVGGGIAYLEWRNRSRATTSDQQEAEVPASATSDDQQTGSSEPHA